MLRRFSFRSARRESDERDRDIEAQNPSFRRTGFLRRDKQRKAKDASPPPINAERWSWNMSGDEQDVYLHGQLEALTLEGIIAPTLIPMRDTLQAVGQMSPMLAPRHPAPTGPLPPAPRRVSVAQELDSPPMPPPNGPSGEAEPHWPHEGEYDPDVPLELPVTPIPRRPTLVRRNAVSMRTRGEISLRTQALRRAQQERLARDIAKRRAATLREPIRTRQGSLADAPFFVTLVDRALPEDFA
jgi:hypothetical protein